MQYETAGHRAADLPTDRSGKIVQQETVYDGWIRLKRVMLQMPCGTVVERHIEDHGTAVSVLPYDSDRRCALLVSMPRAPVLAAGEMELFEAISGRLDDDDPQVCAKREAMEEAGVRLVGLEEVGFFWSMPTQSLERIRYFLAPYAITDRLGPGGGSKEEGENVTVHELPLSSLPAMIVNGQLSDLKTIMLVQMLQLRRPHLFEAGCSVVRD